jgi:hypothetical protein
MLWTTAGCRDLGIKRKGILEHAGLRACVAFIAALIVLDASNVQGQIACQYEVVATIQGPNCFENPTGLVPAAISPSGLYVTGSYLQCVNPDDEAFLWIGPPPGTRITIPRPPGIVTAKGADVNDDGVVGGTYRTTSCGNDKGFVWKYQTGP